MADNTSKNAFSFNPWGTQQGTWLQYVAKETIIHTLNFLHYQIKDKYDAHAYELDDVRLERDKAMLIDFFVEWTEERIQKIINTAADIFFFFLKEDGRYRRLYIVLRNKLIIDGQIYALSTTEQHELEKWKGK